MDLSDPARNAFCCVSLRTAIWSIIFVDVFYSSLTLSRIATDYLSFPSSNFNYVSISLYSVLFALTISGALFGVMGLIKSGPGLLSFYASTAICRIAVSLVMTAYSLYHVQLLAEPFVDAWYEKLSAKAAATGDTAVSISREELRRSTEGGLIGSMVFLELTTDIILLYFAYVIQSLAEWMKRGQSHPGDQTTPLLQTAV